MIHDEFTRRCEVAIERLKEAARNSVEVLSEYKRLVSKVEGIQLALDYYRELVTQGVLKGGTS